MSYPIIKNVSRRTLLRGTVGAGALVLAAPMLPRRAFAAAGYATGAGAMPHGTVNNPRIFVAIAPDGIVTIVAHRAEMGTASGTRPSLRRSIV